MEEDFKLNFDLAMKSASSFVNSVLSNSSMENSTHGSLDDHLPSISNISHYSKRNVEEVHSHSIISEITSNHLDSIITKMERKGYKRPFRSNYGYEKPRYEIDNNSKTDFCEPQFLETINFEKSLCLYDRLFIKEISSVLDQNSISKFLEIILKPEASIFLDIYATTKRKSAKDLRRTIKAKITIRTSLEDSEIYSLAQKISARNVKIKRKHYNPTQDIWKPKIEADQVVRNSSLYFESYGMGHRSKEMFLFVSKDIFQSFLNLMARSKLILVQITTLRELTKLQVSWINKFPVGSEKWEEQMRHLKEKEGIVCMIYKWLHNQDFDSYNEIFQILSQNFSENDFFLSFSPESTFVQKMIFFGRQSKESQS